MDTNPLVEMHGITKSYRLSNWLEIPVLRGIDLTIQSGEFVALMGQSGSGKSTLLNIIWCLHAPSDGTYLLEGTPISMYGEERMLSFIRNRKIGFIFQQYFLIPRLTARENVILPSMYAREPESQRKEKAAYFLQKVGLADKMYNRPSELSGGQQQRVAIARALINDPALILADEPTGALDSTTSAEVMDLITSLHEWWTAVVMVTHESRIAAYAKRIILLKDGKVENSAYTL
jgi:putative ABC transport system ATP-binding protein